MSLGVWVWVNVRVFSYRKAYGARRILSFKPIHGHIITIQWWCKFHVCMCTMFTWWLHRCAFSRIVAVGYYTQLDERFHLRYYINMFKWTSLKGNFSTIKMYRVGCFTVINFFVLDIHASELLRGLLSSSSQIFCYIIMWFFEENFLWYVGPREIKKSILPIFNKSGKFC